MAKQTKETYHAEGKRDHALVKIGNPHARARMHAFAISKSWQARAYNDGMQEAADIENGYYTPAAIWTRTPHAERLAHLHKARLPGFYAAKAYADMRASVQARLAAAINGDDVPENEAAPAVEPAPAPAVESVDAENVRFAAAYSRMQIIVSNRARAARLRATHGKIESLPIGKRMQGPRHAPGLQWPSGERIARSQICKVEQGTATRWQWAAFNDDEKVIMVCEFSDLWTLREIAAYNIADMYRFVRSHKGH